MHPKMIMECAKELAVPLTLLYNESLSAGKLPDMWKRSNVVAIYKKGKRDLPNNYRPVSLTCVACKVLESLVKEDMVAFLDEERILSERQHGFVNRRSCLTNLLEAIEDWTREMDQGSAVDVIYLDYSKAFDTVPHKRLLHKLRAYGFTGKLLDWIRDFLFSRKMRVVIRGKSSDWRQVTSGVPQGSVLGPLLFVLYVNDIPVTVSSSSSMFADDTKLWRKVTDQAGRDGLQQDLVGLRGWSEDWLMDFNVDKCKVMHMGCNNSEHDYAMVTDQGLKTLQKVDTEKDLGVWISKDLKPSVQCGKAAAKAMQALRTVRKTFLSITRSNFHVLYKTFIRPHLEFCIQAWRPYLKKDVQRLESVQRRATRMVDGLRDMSYERRLKELGMSTLEARRDRGDCIEAYKILTGKERVRSETFFKPGRTAQLRGHTMKVFIQHSRCQVRKMFFSQRVAPMWNSLPQHVVDAATLNTFKNRYDQWKMCQDVGTN